MSKINDDKYYTDKELAKNLIDLTINTINAPISEIIEPSAGNGAFSNQISDCIAYDILPDNNKIIKQDFLKLNIEYKKYRLCIGNPPFGVHNSLLRKFYVKCCNIGDYIDFIMPISQLNNNISLYEFDLIKSVDLGLKQYSDRKLHCCFNIYKRPNNGLLNDKPNYKLNDITIIEYRRNSKSYYKDKIKPNYDYCMCNWGNGTLGKTPNYIGQYAQEVYFYIHNKKYKNQILNLLEYDNIRNYVNSISMKRISVMRLYKYLKDNIKDIK